MKFLLFAFLLQSLVLPPRAALENPASVSEIPPKLKKDYDKTWARFLDGRQDPRVAKDLEKLLKKKRDLHAALVVQAYLDLYSGRTAAGESKLEKVLSSNSQHRIAIHYLAELAFLRNEYARAADLYKGFLDLVPGRTDAQLKREKAVLLATENLIQQAWKAEQDNRMEEAEALFKQALRIAPEVSTLHSQIGQLLTRQMKWEEALEHFRKQSDLEGPSAEVERRIAEALMRLGRAEEARRALDPLRASGATDEELERKLKELDDLGRWGRDIERLREIEASPAITREQLATVLVRYFPQLAEFRQTPRIVTDIQTSRASTEIQTIVGIGLIDPLPNHTFQPASAVTRSQFAVALARLFPLLGLSEGSAPPIPASDVVSTNPVYRDIQLALVQGLLRLDDQGNFNLSGMVSGEEAVRAAEKLRALTRNSGA